ncbi:MAG: signal peptidase I [Desulfobacteraceae bacterium]|nr:signal peptidase I [Desulfobacteraceae bacterium]
MKKDYSKIIEPLLTDGYCIQKTISGDSMLPAIPSETIARIEPVNQTQIFPGEVVLFKTEQDQTKIHRVAIIFKRNGEKFIQTWGDNCRFPDSPVRIDHVMGRVTGLKNKKGWYPLKNSTRQYLRLFLSRYSFYYLKKIIGK